MSNSFLKLAIDDLTKYFTYSGRQDAVTRAAGKAGLPADIFIPSIPAIPPPAPPPPVTPTKPTPDQVRTVMDMVSNITDGAIFTHKLIENLSGLEITNIGSIIKVYFEEAGVTKVKGAVPEFIGMLEDNKTPVSIRRITSSGVPTESEFPTLDGGVAGTNVNPMDPNKFTTPGLSAIVLPKLEIGLSTRNADAVALFMNAIPTVQMSLCAPYIDLRIITDRPMLGDIISPGEGKLNDLSLSRFLGVYEAKRSDDTNFILASASPKGFELAAGAEIAPLPIGLGSSGDSSDVDAGAMPNISNAGMEIFTSPQTLVNPEINRDRAASGFPDVLDPMVPLATLEGIQFTDQLAGNGMIGYSKASVNIRLHDRSRMPELAVLMNPQTFSMGSFIIEYGWSHPHALLAPEIDANNVARAPNAYANFLNSLRSRLKYKLTTSNFTLTDDGQVSITLNMISMGGAATPEVHISEGAYVNSRLVKGLLTKLITQTLGTVDKNAKNIEIMPKQLLTPVDKLAKDTLVPRKTLIDIVSNFKEKNADSAADISGIADFIKAQLDAVVADSSKAKVNAASETKKKLKALENTGGVGDPWLTDIDTGKTSASTPKPRTETNTTDTGDGTVPEEASTDGSLTGEAEDEGAEESFKGWASLGKVVMSFIGRPLAATHKYDEVQVIFYGFNPLAGPFADYSVANYPISVNAFSKKVLELMKQPQNLTVAKMMSLLSNIVSNPTEDPYGFSDAYGNQYETEEESESGEDDSEIAKASSIKMAEMNILRSHFQAPELKFWIETVPDVQDKIDNITGASGSPDTKSTTQKKTPGKEICRVHVYDSNAHPYMKTATLLDVLKSDEFAGFYKDAKASLTTGEDAPEPSADQVQQTGNKIDSANKVGELEEEEIVEIVRDDNEMIEVMRQKVDTETVRAKIRSETPTITYGTMFSPITNISLSAATSGGVNNAIIGREILAAKKEEGSKKAPTHVPDMLVTPASLTVKCVGNPLIRHGQYFYMDLGTGTTADNLYTVTNVTHDIGPGKFETSFKLTYAGNKIEAMRNQLVSAYVVLKGADSELV